MIRYRAAALAFKAFSANAVTRSCYRTLGNRLKDRATVDVDGYVRDASWILSRIQGDRPISHAAEIGTGWMHFYGIVLALSGIPQVDLYDVWDNRQLQRLKRAFRGFERYFDALPIKAYARESAMVKLDAISSATSFEEIYERLGLRYSLEPLSPGSYDLVCSMDVIEHVYADDLRGFVERLFRSLAPGGLSLHHIGLDDHLAHYDRHASPKEYLSIPENCWRLWYENRVQYFNRVPVHILRTLFEEAGFEPIETSVTMKASALNGLRIAPQFRDQPEESLQAVRGYFVHRKPG